MRLKVSPAKWRPFCLGLNVLIRFPMMMRRLYNETAPWRTKEIRNVIQTKVDLSWLWTGNNKWICHPSSNVFTHLFTNLNINILLSHTLLNFTQQIYFTWLAKIKFWLKIYWSDFQRAAKMSWNFIGHLTGVWFDSVVKMYQNYSLKTKGCHADEFIITGCTGILTTSSEASDKIFVNLGTSSFLSQSSNSNNHQYVLLIHPYTNIKESIKSSASLAICEENPTVNGGFSHKFPVMKFWCFLCC